VPRTTGPLTGGNATCAVDLSGNRTPRAPTFTANINATYKVPTTIGDIALTGTVYHNSGFAWDSDNRLRQPDYTTVNARASWTSSDGRYEITAWGKNLTNKYYFDYISASPTRDSGQPAMPRSGGVSFGMHY
jgi:iron complex outermembrane receptor protein